MSRHNSRIVTTGLTGRLFDLGSVRLTPGAIEALQIASPGAVGLQASVLLRRHVTGDFGDLCNDDWFANMQALLHGDRILSRYNLPIPATEDEPRPCLWIITEAETSRGRRPSTTILTPSEY